MLLDDMKIPTRDNLRTIGDMARLLLADEEAMLKKNADMQALRQYRAAMLQKAQQ